MTTMMDKIRACFQNALVLSSEETAQVGLDTDVWNLPKWDSLGHLRLILELEKEFGIKIPDERTAEMISVEEIQKACSGS